MNRCPPDHQLVQFLDERLTEAESRVVAGHVGNCERCQTVLERLTEEGADEPSFVLPRARSTVPPDAHTSPEFLTRLRQSPPRNSGSDKGQGPSLADPPAPDTFQVPGYEILREVGRGGMGVIYQARHIGLNRLVALKMVRAGAAAGPKELARFRQEAEAVARLHHSNIVQIYDIGECAGQPYLALEYVGGGSLVQHLRGDPQPVYPAARLLETLARAVHFAHAQGIVHRDLKPANILLQHDQRASVPDGNFQAKPSLLSAHAALLVPKIADFGLAQRVDEQPSGSSDTTEMVGTPSYMAPEQAAGQGRPVGPAADVYALGAILYEMLTGRPPFKGPTPLDTVLQVLHEEPIRPSRLRPKLPRDLETICLKCLEKDPLRRYRSAAALADDLRSFRHGAPIKARPVSARERAWKWALRRPVYASLLLGLVLVTVLGFAGITWQWREAAGARDAAVAEKREKEAQKEHADQARNAAERAQQQEAEQRRQARNALYYSRIAQSELQWRVNDFPSAEQTLAQCLPAAGLVDRRGWEWFYLRNLYRTELFTLRHRTEGLSGCVAVRADGRWLASVQGGHSPEEKGRVAEVRIWDARSGDVVQSWMIAATFHRLAISPDGGRIALVGTDGNFIVRDVAARQDVLRQQPHSDTIAAVAFSPDGKALATAGWDGVAKISDASTGEVAQTLQGHAGRLHHVAFHPSGRLVATAGHDTTVRIWDATTGQTVRVLRGHKSPVYGVAFSPDGELLVSAGSNGNLKIWEVAAGRVTQSLTGQTGAVLSVAFSPDGRYLAYGGGDTTVRVWDVESGVERIVFRGHTAPVDSVQFTPDGQRLVSGSAGHAAVKIWDLTRHPEHGTLARTSADIEALAFRDGGRRLVSAAIGGKLQSWDASSGVLLQEFEVPLSAELMGPGVMAAFSPTGDRLVGRGRGEGGKVARIWDAATGAELTVLRGQGVPITCVRFSWDGRYVATGGYDSGGAGRPRELIVWDAATGANVATVRGEGAIFNLLFSRDGKSLALAGEGGNLMVVDWADGHVRFQTKAHRGDVSSLAFSPDGHRLASGGQDDRTVKVWEWAAPPEAHASAPALTLTAPRFVCDLAFSPDGRRLAGINHDLVKLWDAETGQEVLTLRGAPQRHFDPLFNPRVLFSTAGKRLVGTNWDESISVWEADAQGSTAQMERRQANRRRAADDRADFWHLQEAEHCLEHKNPAAARFHLQRVTGVELPDALRNRRDRLVKQLAKATTPTAEP